MTSTNSGLSVPDWPSTFGQNMFTFPPSLMKGGIFYEHGHRLLASFIGLLTVGISCFLWIKEKRRWLQWTGSAALLLVIAQGILGGLTVRLKLPMPVSAAHACVAELFFLLTILLTFTTSKVWINASRKKFHSGLPQQSLSATFCLVIFLQILIGAVMRHSYAGLSIPTFPLAFGQFIPPFWNFGIWVHFLHTRIVVLAVVILGSILIYRVLASRLHAKMTKIAAGFLGMCLVLQCLLGMFTVWSLKAPVLTTIHLSVGALVFGTGFLLLLTICRLSKPFEDRKPQ